MDESTQEEKFRFKNKVARSNEYSANDLNKRENFPSYSIHSESGSSSVSKVSLRFILTISTSFFFAVTAIIVGREAQAMEVVPSWILFCAHVTQTILPFLTFSRKNSQGKGKN